MGFPLNVTKSHSTVSSRGVTYTNVCTRAHGLWSGEWTAKGREVLEDQLGCSPRGAGVKRQWCRLGSWWWRRSGRAGAERSQTELADDRNGEQKKGILRETEGKSKMRHKESFFG